MSYTFKIFKLILSQIICESCPKFNFVIINNYCPVGVSSLVNESEPNFHSAFTLT